MGRRGTNPMKWSKTVHAPSKCALTTIVHIPILEGYWENSLDVLKICLDTMVANAGEECDLYVLDNGSCEEVEAFLESQLRQKKIYCLLRVAENVGKVGGWNLLFGAVPNKIISYSDSDVYFFPGWLTQTLNIMEAFPEAGMVTAQPIPGNDLSLLWTARQARQCKDVVITQGRLIPDKYLHSVVAGLGRGQELIEKREKNRNDVRISRNGIEAYTTASHFQFTTRKDVVQRLFPAKTEIPIGDDLQFEEPLEQIGYWRLATTEYLVHHMGNTHSDLARELPWAELPKFPTRKKEYTVPVIKNHYLRSVLKRVYRLTYKMLG